IGAKKKYSTVTVESSTARSPGSVPPNQPLAITAAKKRKRKGWGNSGWSVRLASNAAATKDNAEPYWRITDPTSPASLRMTGRISVAHRIVSVLVPMRVAPCANFMYHAKCLLPVTQTQTFVRNDLFLRCFLLAICEIEQQGKNYNRYQGHSHVQDDLFWL